MGRLFKSTMARSKNSVTGLTVGFAVIIGIAFNEFISQYSTLPQIINLFITFLLSSTIHQFLFWLFSKFISHFEFLLKLYWGKLYLKGYWSYVYTVNGEKRYGAWCIDQDVDGITVKGFGITANRIRRSDVQSLTSLIPRGNDYEIVNMRRDIGADGTMSDFFYYSKTTLHLQQRTTFLSLFNYPLVMDGSTYVYGGLQSGNIHQQLVFRKHKDAKNEHDIEEIVLDLINGL